MSRPLRIQYEGALYHVSARGNERRRIFWEKVDYDSLLKLIEEACGRFSLAVSSFALMTNHFHLMVRTPLANLSQAMHWIKTGYTVALNRRRKRCGHLFQGRYHSVLVEEESHALELSRYIHLNPVRAGMVKRPEAYEWSSCRDYLRPKQRFPWVERDAVLSQLGGAGRGRYERYREFLEAGAGQGDGALDAIRKAVVLGSESFREELKARYAPERAADVLGAKRLAAPLPIERARDAISRALARRHAQLRDDRAVLMYLLYLMGYGLREIGLLFGVGYSAVSHNARRNAARVEAEVDAGALMSNVKR